MYYYTYMMTGEKLDNSLYGEMGYWPLNFNDMPSGCK